MNPEPRVPSNLHPLAREILEELRRRPQAGSVVIGGGVALQHYCEYRETVDLDAWWTGEVPPDAEDAIREVMEAVASRHDLSLSVRSWRETRSFELEAGGSARTIFSLQISRRTVELLPPLDSAWAPVKIESFSDNLGAKMNAVVDRGAPRDLLDVYELCRRGLATEDACWDLWRRKNPSSEVDEAKLSVLHHLEGLEARRPLEGIPDPAARDAARAVREWVRASLCRRSGSA